ncbi:MAG: hypothetical protein IOC90_07195 [Methylocystis sp.]|nr:hypothetical protein [Methylocystis sp.]MCA3585315.1 hypothetical protein [Methylocystis sp.]MCA3587805.1 hypothetical protein [Methylocystis sp.]MCA3593196.1 hypothetical protein [Methylocystis sp.]
MAYREFPESPVTDRAGNHQTARDLAGPNLAVIAPADRRLWLLALALLFALAAGLSLIGEVWTIAAPPPDAVIIP